METTAPTVRDKILRAMADLPADATYEDAMERLYLLLRVEEGLRQVAAGEVLTQGEVEQSIRSRWPQ